MLPSLPARRYSVRSIASDSVRRAPAGLSHPLLLLVTHARAHAPVAAHRGAYTCLTLPCLGMNMRVRVSQVGGSQVCSPAGTLRPRGSSTGHLPYAQVAARRAAPSSARLPGVTVAHLPPVGFHASCGVAGGQRSSERSHTGAGRVRWPTCDRRESGRGAARVSFLATGLTSGPQWTMRRADSGWDALPRLI